MSYAIQFPPRPLPANFNSAPHAMFAIHGKPFTFPDVEIDIPLSLVLHFAPKLNEWLLEPPHTSQYSNYVEAHLKPVVGINIQADIPAEGLFFIVKRMLQCAGISLQRQLFGANPSSTLRAVHILKAWQVLELPKAGALGVETHILMQMMMGPPVTAVEIILLWGACPVMSPIIREMAQNYIRNFIDCMYPENESSFIQDWIEADQARRNFFRQFLPVDSPSRGSIHTMELGAGSSGGRSASEGSSRRRSRRLSVYERSRGREEQVEARDRRKEARRLHRTGSAEGIRLVANELLPTEPASGQQGMTDRWSTPVDTNLLTAALEGLRVQVAMESQPEAAPEGGEGGEA